MEMTIPPARARRRRPAALLLLGGLLLAPGRVDAQARDPALARKHFEAAETAYRQGRFREALKGYEKALGYHRHAAFIFNIAQCHRQLRQYAQARFFYELFLAESPRAANREEVEGWVAKMKALQDAERRRRSRRGRLSIVTDPPGASLYVDAVRGKPQGTTPALLELSAGEHLIFVRRAGFVDAQRAVVVRTGKITVLELRLTAAGATVAPAATASPRRPFHARWWFWTGVAVTGAALAAAVGTGVETLRLRDQWNAAGGPPADDPGFERRFKTLRTTTDVLLGAALVTATATLIGALLVGRGSAERPPRGRAASPPLVSPGCGPSGCGLWVTGRF